MKKMSLIFALCVGLVGCGGNASQSAENQADASMKDGVEVLYFHGKQRCATCMAIESNATEVVKTQFADQVENGDVVFKIVNIEEDEALADKYQITWSSLVLVDYDSGVERAENITEFAFAKARTAPDEFKSELKTKIETLLNN